MEKREKEQKFDINGHYNFGMARKWLSAVQSGEISVSQYFFGGEQRRSVQCGVKSRANKKRSSLSLIGSAEKGGKRIYSLRPCREKMEARKERRMH